MDVYTNLNRKRVVKAGEKTKKNVNFEEQVQMNFAAKPEKFEFSGTATTGSAVYFPVDQLLKMEANLLPTIFKCPPTR